MDTSRYGANGNIIDEYKVVLMNIDSWAKAYKNV